jgi:hypothetical protein
MHVTAPGDNAAMPDFGPPLPAPRVRVVGRGVTGAGDVLATTRVSVPIAIEVEIVVPFWTRVLRGVVVVAVPGSISGFPPPRLLARAAHRQENHLATSPPLVDATDSTHQLTVSFQAADPGTYPVFYLCDLVEADTRWQPAPPADGGRVLNGCQELGDIVVQ